MLMRVLRITGIVLGCQALVFGAQAQTLLEIQQDETPYNLHSQAGVPLSTTDNVPPGSDGLAPTPGQQEAAGLTPDPATTNQFQGVITFGAVWPYGTNNNLEATTRLQSARVSSPYVSRSVSFLYGSVIPVPSEDENGASLSNPEIYWLAEPHSENNHEGERYYWSKHAQKVYATQSGPVDIIWRKSTSPTTRLTNSYVISSSPVKTPRKIYWTEQDFRSLGKPVNVPPGRVRDVHIVYSPNFPENVHTNDAVISKAHIKDSFLEVRTLWYNPSFGQILAYNKEGRTFVELLGDSIAGQGDRRQHLSFEIVDVIQQPNPFDVTTDLGEVLTAYQGGISPAGEPAEDDLFPEPLTQLGLGFFHQQNIAESDRIKLHAEVETQNLNDVQVHWLEEGEEGLRWPRRFVRYKLVWPSNIAKYSHYVRPQVATEEEAKETAVKLAADNAPIIAYQDPFDQPRAKLEQSSIFYTWLTPQVLVHRTLIRFIAAEHVAYERVFSWLDEDLRTLSTDAPNAFANAFDKTPVTHLSDWNTNSLVLNIDLSAGQEVPRVISQLVRVGDRITAPLGELGGGLSTDYLAGYIIQTKGNSFNPNAYVDPFEAGFEAANLGSIIPVNAIPNQNKLEVLWFREKVAEQDKGFNNIFWPAVIGRYTLEWDEAKAIVLASNDGSGPLPSLQAKARIYTQNDRALPGYNPNEEHALMQGGQAFALRDDLNVKSGANYSSHPYVLLEYTEEDERPAMRVFEVLREDEEEGITFNYQVEAGSILQPPMPLPLLEKPSLPRLPGQSVLSLNHEVPLVPPNPDPRAKFTLQDRKENVWVYRGPHDENDRSSMQMRFYYKTLPGFWFPQETTQPALGTLTPYLRPINGVETFAGKSVLASSFSNAIDTNALVITYRPVWPEDTPVLQMAETLTLPKRGLPSMRGQTSLEVFYQQSQVIGGDNNTAVVLHDPTREKAFELGPDNSTTLLKAIPDSVLTESFRGKTFFPRLPPHLVERLFLDPNRGANGALVFKGEFVDAPLGDDYLNLNVLGQMDLKTLKELTLTSDPNKGKWDAAMDALSTSMELFTEDPGKPGTFRPTSKVSITATNIAVVTDDDVAVDSYALTAIGPGTGFVTLIAGNGLAFTPVEEPVTVYVVKVVDTLYRGEVNVIEGSNPLSEKLTLQQVTDLAGAVEQYNFEWLIASPVDGFPPSVYQNTPRDLLTNPDWSHVRFPLSTDKPGTVHTTIANRISKDVPPGSITPVSRINYSGLTQVNKQLRVTPSPSSHGLVAGNQIVIRKTDNTTLLGTLDTQTTPTVVVIPVNISANTVIALSEGVVTNRAQSIVFTEMNVDVSKRYTQFWLSLELDSALGAKVYLDGQLVVTANTGQGDTATTSAPGTLFPLSRIYRLSTEALAGGTPNLNGMVKHRVAVEFFSQALPDTQLTFALKLEAFESVDVTAQQWIPLDEERFEDGVRAVLGGTADIRSLTDNYLVMRYQANSPAHASWVSDPLNAAKNIAWSAWTEPILAEGWIKRVLKGINPFNQRLTDFFNNQVNTEVSLVQQAGERWEGDVALNLETINDSGLIAIYETVFGRGKNLSIDGGINYGPANDALLLVTGYLNDLYMVLGNEALADASNPTIGIGTKNSTFRDIATALFSFKGQLPTLLEEELALLRGRDDFFLPGVELRPVYNRMVWNYTRGIDSGEVIYALNYNILDQDVNGVIDADDARKLFPQGHGDAYGHYLTALKGYYGLLLDPNFDWVPRIEAVTVLGKPISVDYLDERKFAAAASALARAGKQVFDLTWRKDYQGSEDQGWGHFSATRDNSNRSSGPSTRYWGVDHWASRTGQGSYLNWIIGNAILPDVDPDPTHEGIQKVDRTTVPELKELPAVAESLQVSLDNAEAFFTPLGLPKTTIPFDLNPVALTGGQKTTHFVQIFDRAKGALKNALVAFDDAKDVTRLLRSEGDSLADFKSSIAKEELAFVNTLIELYGTPYPDDIGPGKTYKTGYTGPDLIHYMYVETPESDFNGLLPVKEELKFRIDTQTFTPTWLDANGISDFAFIKKARPNGTDGPPTHEGETNTNLFVEFNLSSHGFFEKPSAWRSRRASPGQIQQAISEIIKARNNAYEALYNADSAKGDLDWAINALERKKVSGSKNKTIKKGLLALDEAVRATRTGFDILSSLRIILKR